MVVYTKPGQDQPVRASVTFTLRLSAPGDATQIRREIVINQAAEDLSALNMLLEGTRGVIGAVAQPGAVIEKVQGFAKAQSPLLGRLKLFVKLTKRMSTVSSIMKHGDI